MSDPYLILIRSDEAYTRSQPADSLQQRLASIPTVRTMDQRQYQFGEPDEHGVMSIGLARHGAQTPDHHFDKVEISIPRPWVQSNGPQVFAIVFMIQGWTDWVVYDPQIDDTLQREVVLQGLVAMRQAQMESDANARVPRPELKAPIPSDSDRSTATPGDSDRPAPAPPKSSRRRWRFW